VRLTKDTSTTVKVLILREGEEAPIAVKTEDKPATAAPVQSQAEPGESETENVAETTQEEPSEEKS